jgi:arginine deiminase
LKVLGSLHSTGALFEKPVNIELARKHHTKFRDIMKSHDIKVYTVRDILLEDCETNLKARVDLEDLAQSKVSPFSHRHKVF